ncbi:hypothetical protein EDEG_03300 [Edhazardia aedis USNM 41457]|uniref:Uncharacterized protein n=1 Tax=Edhazardia aedis (strain USNM 41457) TaxID=1003232 RepID=J8ZRD9_EDHAE|nr:hypothetical protein EDEG_03300 [Edhazardia aedis USNM 41457]|eukprot:EJW02263.1 hypothetical protein EDEG_03300 [Edhazardia aedis USNM 41457]
MHIHKLLICLISTLSAANEIKPSSIDLNSQKKEFSGEENKVLYSNYDQYIAVKTSSNKIKTFLAEKIKTSILNKMKEMIEDFEKDFVSEIREIESVDNIQFNTLQTQCQTQEPTSNHATQNNQVSSDLFHDHVEVSIKEICTTNLKSLEKFRWEASVLISIQICFILFENMELQSESNKNIKKIEEIFKNLQSSYNDNYQIHEDIGKKKLHNRQLINKK